MADDTPDTPAADAKPAPKPRARRATPKAADKPTPAKAKPAAKAPPKPRSSQRAAASGPVRTAKTVVAKTRKAATRATGTVGKTTEKVGGRWGAAAIAGGVVAVAGAAAALLLKGSTPRTKPQGKPQHGAKQADGTDSSKSFEAGIADEGTIPNG